ncbi:MAG: hypothetical protein H6577_15650 [Lewinellaceae bacterium]|nr:D-alanine--D-alanine ligase [Saprospiraceae bacterium]MCB9339564.1 hypothetical protein [Lewinellaceae bacterium]
MLSIAKILTRQDNARPFSGETAAGFIQKIQRSIFYIKLTNWEYWPFYISNIPLVLTWAFFALRARKAFFFSAVNPAIETGGMWGESKFNILRRIPSSHVPVTVFVEKGTDFQQILDKMESAELRYPFIAKPNVGERGLLVSKIKNEEELSAYAAANQMDFLLQEFVDCPVELAVMHHRFPGEARGKVTSICIKETLKVTGDGIRPVRALMLENDRARLQLSRFEATAKPLLDKVPANGHTLELEPIGNHCRGTKFLNGNHFIDEKLTAEFDKVAAQMDGIHYGRFDLKCTSVEDLRAGKGFMVMEYNGIGAEPAHIYDPAYPIHQKFLEIFRHWRIIFRIYKIQRRKGETGMSIAEAVERLKTYIAYKKSLHT